MQLFGVQILRRDLKIPIGFLSLVLLFLVQNPAFSQTEDTLLMASTLKLMSLDELMDVEVTSVNNTPVRISDVASAIQVINSEEILRSGVQRLPEAVSLASNLQSARASAKDFAITARGFNGLPTAGGILANKLLVLNDGRSLYTPLLGGVYWDTKNMMLESIDRIEVVSGPGGTLWGANAVNGVINIVSKSAEETQGVYAKSAIGTLMDRQAAVRYGFKLGKGFARVYTTYYDHNAALVSKGVSAQDSWSSVQTGFRFDRAISEKTNITFQGDYYRGTANENEQYIKFNGFNALGRYNHRFSNTSDIRIQAYVDRVDRGTPADTLNSGKYELNTYEIDIKYRKTVGKHNLMVGGMYQYREDETSEEAVTQFDPISRKMPLISGFVQDELYVVKDKLKVTFGSKILNNVYTGIEFQPSVRTAYFLKPFSFIQSQMLWAAVSRAVRLPSRLDADITKEGPDFDSEKVLAYELGYRLKTNKVSVSVSGYYNTYDDLRSLDANTDTTSVFPTLVRNSQSAESWGLEIQGNYQVLKGWRIRGGYSFVETAFTSLNPQVLEVSREFEAVDPKHTVRLQSLCNLGKGWQADATYKYTYRLPQQIFSAEVAGYGNMDVRLAKQLNNFEFSVVGRNLFRPRTKELQTLIPRSFYINFTYSLN